MNKLELSHAIAEKLDWSKGETLDGINTMIDIMTEVLCNGDRVLLHGLGSFKTTTRKPRKARNPRTGESVQVLAKVAVLFKPSKELKARLNE